MYRFVSKKFQISADVIEVSRLGRVWTSEGSLLVLRGAEIDSEPLGPRYGDLCCSNCPAVLLEGSCQAVRHPPGSLATLADKRVTLERASLGFILDDDHAEYSCINEVLDPVRHRVCGHDNI